MANQEGHLIAQLWSYSPDNPQITFFLDQYTDVVLFCIALQSRLLFDIVKGFLVGKMRAPVYWNAPLQYAYASPANLSWDVLLLVIDQLDLPGLRTMSTGCKWLHDEARKYGNRRWDTAFATWGLDWPSVQWFLDVTGSWMSGLTATSLLFPNRRTLDVGRLEFFVPGGAEQAVSRFFRVAASFTSAGVIQEVSPNIKKTLLFDHIFKDDHPIRLAFHILPAATDPKQEIFRQFSTAMFVHLSANALVVPYSKLTFDRLTLPNHSYITLTDYKGIKILNQVNQDTRAAQFHWAEYHADGLGCSSAFYCPSSLRTTKDTDTTIFPLEQRGWFEASTGYSEVDIVLWSLGRMGCALHIRRCEPFVEVVDATEADKTGEKLWLDRFQINTGPTSH
ncbi:hypothetical protein R3P38DRAFT_2792066 [Favolaschia claudopus]|uniref:F-box domain-containing protein n=1 Tax=Favolaschia claudopus TaxID=2862362 RepID=A0AAW0AEZ6_9AGAR